jgi:hypothetical protein
MKVKKEIKKVQEINKRSKEVQKGRSPKGSRKVRVRSRKVKEVESQRGGQRGPKVQSGHLRGQKGSKGQGVKIKVEVGVRSKVSGRN